MAEGISYHQVAKIARRYGFVEFNAYDQHPRAISWRAAVRRAVKHGLLVRRKGCKPSRMIFIPAPDKHTQPA